jgi:hypothetical protein
MRQKELAPLEEEENCQFALEGIGTGVFLTEDACFSLRLFRRTLFDEFLQRGDGDEPNAAFVSRPTNDGGFYETVVHIIVGGRTTDPIERCLGGPNISGFGNVWHICFPDLYRHDAEMQVDFKDIYCIYGMQCALHLCVTRSPS